MLLHLLEVSTKPNRTKKKVVIPAEGEADPLGLRSVQERMDALEAERVRLAAANEDTEFIDGAIRDLEEFMLSAIDEYEAMMDTDDTAKKDGTDTEEKDTSMDIDQKTGEKRDRSETQSAVSGDALRSFVSETGQSFRGFLNKK